MEAHYRTQTGAPLLIGGIPNDGRRETDYALRIPDGLSLLLDDCASGKVVGLEAFPESDWPNVRMVHWAFDLMVACGMTMLALAAWPGWLWWKGRALADDPRLLRALVAAGPLGFVALECGWVVTELGRQPWIIYGVMRTSDAVTPMKGIAVPFVIFTVLYVFLGVIVCFLLRRQFLETAGLKAGTPATSTHV
jgi:cytochrome d ubiquinol oxidase subunit I